MNKISKQAVIEEEQEEKHQIRPLSGGPNQKSNETWKTQLKNTFRWGLISLLVLEGLAHGNLDTHPNCTITMGGIRNKLHRIRVSLLICPNRYYYVIWIDSNGHSNDNSKAQNSDLVV